MFESIVVTGMGILTSNANSIDEYLKALKNGQSGIKGVTLFDTHPYSFDSMGEIKNFESPYTKLDRASQIAMCAAENAISDAGDRRQPAVRIKPERPAQTHQ